DLEHTGQIQLRDQQIRSLRGENRRLNDTVNRLASRRGQPAARSDQPTRALQDTGSLSPLSTPPVTPPPAATGAP
ncbi:MAG: hypothetical protein ABL932_24975, partial [Terricaulis sp.]